MATSPIYNWPEPDNTDLVKNGALAIRTLGNAIDTTMATMVPKSIVDAKGDLIAGTAADTAARLAVGNNGETLVADSSTATGLDWKSAAEQYPWQTWTPTYVNLTLGNGTVVARYQQIGKLVNVYYRLTFGSTTSLSAYPQIYLPVTNARTNYINGVSHIEDAGVAAYTGFCYMESNDRFQVLTQLVNGTYSITQFITGSTIPFTWATGDYFIANFSYEAA